MNTQDAFSSSYKQARAKFTEAAHARQLKVKSYIHPQLGRDGEELAIDAVLHGDAQADKLLIVSSACHGVEGYCGSGVQINALHDAVFQAHCDANKISVLYLHALNPYGFSHIRRFTHENVDLNRNFQDFTKPLPSNPEYRAIHPLLLPKKWPPNWVNKTAIALHIARYGMKALQKAISGGQYEIADGLFYGGIAPTWSNLTLRQILQDHAQHAKQLAWIDLHTGLGETGACERAFAGPASERVAAARAQMWWGNAGATPLTFIGDENSVSSPLTGLMWQVAYDECPQAEITSLAMEFGTQPLLMVLEALRAEQWLTNHPETALDKAQAIKQQLRDAFYVDTDDWKEKIAAQGMQALYQAFSS